MKLTFSQEEIHALEVERGAVHQSTDHRVLAYSMYIVIDGANRVGFQTADKQDAVAKCKQFAIEKEMDHWDEMEFLDINGNNIGELISAHPDAFRKYLATLEPENADA